MLVEPGLSAHDQTLAVAAMNTISTSLVSSPVVREKLWTFVEADPKLTTSTARAALLSYGSTLSRSSLSHRRMVISPEFLVHHKNLVDSLFIKGIKRISALLSTVNKVQIPLVYSAIRNADSSIQHDASLDDGSMPFNKSWSDSREYGSVNTIGATFGADFFVPC
jgi:hypothetical protein